MRSRAHLLAPTCVLLVAIGSASGGSHLWRFNELFSNDDGSIQFIEMRECCGAENETRMENKWIRSASGGNFVFPEDLECCTARRSLLIATESFVALPGAPTPDFIMDPSFFDLVEDEMTYFLYELARFPYGVGDLPTDGIRSMSGEREKLVNSPTNYAGETGSIVVSCNPADLDADGAVTFADVMILLSSWGPCLCPADFDRSGIVDFTDMLAMLRSWGPCE